MAIFALEGLNTVGKIITGIQTKFLYNVRLFVNDFQPQIGMGLSSFLECSLPGYDGIAIDPDEITIDDEADVAVFYYPTFTFTFGHNSGSTTVYGYYIQECQSNTCVWADVLSTPYAVPNVGGSLPLNISVSASNCLM